MRKLCIIIAFMLVLSAFSGCGGQAGEPSEAPETPEPTAAAAESPGPEVPQLEGAAAAHIRRYDASPEGPGWRYDLSEDELAGLCGALRGIVLTGKAAEPEYDQESFSYVDPAQLYRISVSCGGEEGEVFSYDFFEGGVVRMPGGSFYTLEGLDTEVFDDLIAAREYEPKVEADIAAAAEAFRANFAENAPGCAIDELRFDAELDAYWSDLALHDSRFFPIEGKTQADFLALCFRYSAADEADALWLRQGADCVCVMTRNDGVWEFFNWENLPA